VLLLDEIEKAHPEVFNILLQVMDYGKLTDNNGKTVDFRNVILIMTTNAGAADMSKPAMGFMREAREGEDTDAINRLFTPEFRNRLDAVIAFAPLTPNVVAHVVDKFVKELSAQLADKRVALEVDEDARLWLAERGYEPLFGARPLGRVIQEKVKRPLADELLFGRLAKGGKVLVTVEDGELSFVVTAGNGPSLLPPPGETDGDEGEGDREPQVPEPA
jgi:ATP-dependent Clp protease ATP-binding subunit ClpA